MKLRTIAGILLLGLYICCVSPIDGPQDLSAPKDLTAEVADSQVTLTWESVPGADGYEVFYKVGDKATVQDTKVASSTISGTSAVITGLSNGVTYAFIVIATYSRGHGNPTVAVLATPIAPITIPAAPSTPKVTMASGQATVEWTPVEGATTYKVFYNTGTSASDSDFQATEAMISGTSATITGLSEGTQYAFVVIATNVKGDSPISLGATGTTVPGVPNGVALGILRGSVSLSWPSVQGATKYRVFYKNGATASAGDTELSESAISGTAATVDAATFSTGTRYAFTVVATNDSGDSLGSPSVAAIPAPSVYVGGYCENSSGVFVAGYWRDGTWNPLTPLDSTKTSLVNSLVVVASDVYAGGTSVNSSCVVVPGYWLNGNWHALSQLDQTKDGNVSALTINGNDIYVAGYCKNSSGVKVPGIWKNDIWTSLPVLTGGGSVGSIVASGTDVYAVGSLDKSSVGIVAALWKNGVLTELDRFDSMKGAYATSLALFGSDVYVGGSCGDGSGWDAGYWKNGVWNGLNVITKIGSYFTDVSAMVVTGTDVYCGGRNSYGGSAVPCLWISAGSALFDYSGQTFVRSLVANGGDIYATGDYNSGSSSTSKAGYWVNVNGQTWINLPKLDPSRFAACLTIALGN